jgi:hypothetical protein
MEELSESADPMELSEEEDELFQEGDEWIEPIESFTDAPLTWRFFWRVYREILSLFFLHLKSSEGRSLNFSCLSPAWRSHFDRSDAQKWVSEMLAQKSDIFARDEIYFPFFEISGWSWLLVLTRKEVKIQLTIYDFSSSSDIALKAEIEEALIDVRSFLKEAWEFYHSGEKPPLNFEKIPVRPGVLHGLDVIKATTSGWYMLHTFQCLTCGGKVPRSVKNGARRMRQWLSNVMETEFVLNENDIYYLSKLSTNET